MKKFAKLALISFAMLSCLAGCSSTSADKTPEVVTNFKINNETGEFSFTGVSEAKTYYVRIYNHTETKEVTNADGTTSQVELTLDEKMPVAARRIRFKSDVTEYSGQVDFSEFAAGGSYDAYVYTYLRNNDGDLVYSHTDSTNFTYKTTYSTPVLNNSKINAEVADGAVKLSFLNDFFTTEYLDKAPSFLVTSFSGDIQLGTATLKGSDVQSVTVETTNSSGNVETSTESSGSLTLTGVSALEGNSITVQVISNDATAYYDSATSEKVLLDSLVAATPAPGGDEGGFPGGDQGGDFNPGGDQGGDFNPGGDDSGETPNP